MKSVLASKKYYFAGGITIRPRLSVEYGPLEVISDTAIDYFHSIQGVDRFQKAVTNDFELDDRRFVHSVSLRYRHPYSWSDAPRPPAFAQAPWIRVERSTREGGISALTKGFSETRYQAGVSLLF